MPAAVSGYSRLQIALHWTVFLLVAFQIVGHEAIVRVADALGDNAAPAAGDLTMANLHVAAGIAIFALVAWRIFLLLTRGGPQPPASEHPALRILAKATHGLLYLLLIGLPISGAAAWFGGVDAAAFAHATAKYVLLALIVLHVVGALAHNFVFRTDVLVRMVKPEA